MSKRCKYMYSIDVGSGGDERILTLEDGIPRLERTISETGPSIPTDDDHEPAKWIEREFGLLDDSIMEQIKHKPSRLFTDQGRIRYSSENDVANLVKSFTMAVIDALGLKGQVEVHSAMGTFNIRPDLWVVSFRGVPMRYRSKKTDVPNRPKALTHPNVLGELYNFMKHLPNFYGVSPSFGILTNLNTWRMAWLPGEGVDTLAAESEGIDQDEDADAGDEQVLVLSQSDSEGQQVGTHGLTEEEDVKHENSHQIDDSERMLHVSKIFTKVDTDLVRAVASAICKMLRCRVTPLATPFDRMEKRTILKFVKGPERAIFWTRLVVEPRWHKVGVLKKYLYAIQDLGYGADGRVWLTCTSSGAVCVLKFSLKDSQENIDQEYAIWKKAYPDLPVYKEIWCGHPTLRMPPFSRVLPSEQQDNIGLVRDSLTGHFAERQLQHKDIYWRNIGTYKKKNGKEYAVIFDMASVDSVEGGDTDWIEEACAKLSLPNAGENEGEESESEEYF